jgi:Patatin-like phospholipase
MFDHHVLDDTLQKIIAESSLNLRPDAPLADDSTCKTFVIAIRIRSVGAAVRMRTYNTSTTDAFSARIWEAAHATSAAPAFFKPITINGVTYSDGGPGWNNPTMEAIFEAHKIWPNRPIGCLLSVGTGLEKAIQLIDNGSSKSEISYLLRLLTSNDSFQSDIAKYCVDSLMSCEKMHRDVSSHPHIIPHMNYFRFNVPQGMSEIGLAEWKKSEDIIALTETYMEHEEIIRWKVKIADRLLNSEVTD